MSRFVNPHYYISHFTASPQYPDRARTVFNDHIDLLDEIIVNNAGDYTAQDRLSALYELDGLSTSIAANNVTIPKQNDPQGWHVKHPLSSDDQAALAKRYAVIAHRLHENAKHDGTNHSYGALKLMLAAHTIASAPSKDSPSPVWPDMVAVHGDFIHSCFADVVETDPRGALYLANSQQSKSSQPFNPIVINRLFQDKAAAMRRQPEIGQDTSKQALADRLRDNAVQNKATVADLETVVRHAVAMSQDMLNVTSLSPDEAKQARKAKNLRDDAANADMLSGFAALKDTLAPQEQLQLWMHIHGQSRQNTKLRNIAKSQIKKIFAGLTKTPDLQPAFYDALSGLLTAKADHRPTDAAQTTRLSDQKADITPSSTLSLVASLALQSLRQDHPIAPDQRLPSSNTLTLPERSMTLHDVLLETLIATAKTKKEAAARVDQLLQHELTQYQTNISGRPDPRHILDHVRTSHKRGVALDRDTVSAIDHATQTDRHTLAKQNASYDRYDAFLARYYASQATKASLKASTRQAMWNAYHDSIDNMAVPHHQLRTIARSAERLADRYPHKPKNSAHVIPVMQRHIDQIATMDNHAVDRGLSRDGVFGMRHRLQTLHVVAHTVGALYPEAIGHALADTRETILHDFHRNRMDALITTDPPIPFRQPIQRPIVPQSVTLQMA